MADPDRWSRLASGFALAGTLGFSFLAATLAGAGVGYLCDRSLGFRPIVFTLIFGTLGAAAGFRYVVRAAFRSGGVGGSGASGDREVGTRDPGSGGAEREPRKGGGGGSGT